MTIDKQSAPSPLQDTMSKGRWLVAAGLAANGWAMTLPYISLGLLLPQIRQSFPMSDTEAGWLGSSFTLGNVIIIVPVAAWFSRQNPWRLMVIAVTLGAGATFMHAFAAGFWVLLLARLGVGASVALRTPARALLTHRCFSVIEVPVVFGIVMASTGAAEFAALYGTPILADIAGGWRGVYHVYGAVGAIIALCWMVVGKRHKWMGFEDLTARDKAPLRAVLQYREVWLVALGTTAATFSWWAFATFWPTYMLEAHQMEPSRSGLIFGISSAATVPASLVLGYYARKVQRRRLLLSVSAVVIAATSAGMILTGDLLTLVGISVLSGLGWGYIPIALAVPYEIPGIRPREIAVSGAVITGSIFAGGIVGPVLVGGISDFSGSLFIALMISSWVPLIMVLTTLWMRR